MSDFPDPILIRRVIPRNFLSFGVESPNLDMFEREEAGLELRALNVVIGPNGSGKSNLIEAISFMRAAPRGLREVTRKGGGVREWIGKDQPNEPASVELIFRRVGGEFPLRHLIAFQERGQEFVLQDEQITDRAPMGDFYYLRAYLEGPSVSVREGIQRRLAGHDPTQSILVHLRDAETYPELGWLTEVYERIRIYREWSFGRTSVFRQPQMADARRHVLEEDFSNLGLFLNRISTEFPRAKRAILEALQDLYDGITGYDVSTNGGTVQVVLHEGDHVIPATRLSDGTLRYLCLLAILCDPEPPPLICLEEPELGLHPDILPKLADLLRAASERTQILVTTHSDILVDAMTPTPEAVVVCSKENGRTRMTRLDVSELQAWLAEYRLGQLWIRGDIGGTRW